MSRKDFRQEWNNQTAQTKILILNGKEQKQRMRKKVSQMEWMESEKEQKIIPRKMYKPA